MLAVPVAPPSSPSTSSTARLLRNASFRSLLVGYAASVTALYVGNVVIEWLIATSNATKEAAVLLTILGIIEFVPTLTIGVFAGAWADRYDRRHLMIGAQLARAATFGALAILVLREGFNPLVILAAVFVLSALGSVYGPAFNSLLPSVVETHELTPANGILEFGSTVSGFVGSPLGGALVFTLGIGVGFLTNSLLYAFSALATGWIVVLLVGAKDPAPPTKARTSQFSEVRAGLSFLRSQRALLTLTMVGMVLNFFTYYLVFVVLYTRSILHAGPGVFGILLGASSVGYAVGALLPDRVGSDRSPGVWIPLAWACSGAPLLLLVLVPVVPVAIASMAVMGVLNSIVGVTFTSVVQRTVPDRLLGRFFATDTALSYAMIPAGLAFGGILIVTDGVGAGFLVAGAGILIAGLLPLLSREVRDWGRTPTTAAGT